MDEEIAGRCFDPSDLVRACYRTLLGREPEDEAVVAAKATFETPEALLRDFLASTEYRRRVPPHFHDFYLTTPRAVDVDVTPAQLELMFQRIGTEWSKLGASDPYWSVLTEESFRQDSLDEAAQARFYQSGEETARLLDVVAGRCGVVPKREGLCIELGCGVGRVTTHLAERFEGVLALDISPGNLAVCAKTIDSRRQKNVELQLLTSPEDLEKLPACEFFFSTIVLQHNPPPVQMFMLDIILSKLTPGGGFFFQTPTHTPEYGFDAKQYLASQPGGMEMHCLPMASVFRLLSKHALAPLEVLMDGWTGLYGSHTFFGVRPGEGSDSLTGR